MKLAMLTTDWFIYGLFLLSIVAIYYMRKVPHLREPWRRVLKNRVGMVALTVLMFYVVVGLLDSVHFEVTLSGEGKIAETRSVLDLMMRSTASADEQSYSAPFATHAFTKSTVVVDDHEQQIYLPLKFGGAHVSGVNKKADILQHCLQSVLLWIPFIILVLGLWSWILARRASCTLKSYWQHILRGTTSVCWREIYATFAVITLCIFCLAHLYQSYHIMGTDKVGHDVFYASIKSIRTGLVIGTLTTVFVLPFALVLGMVAGFFSGWLDDAIQYLYTTLSSIPGVLLISATILVLQVYIDVHSSMFTTLAQRADARLLALCVVLGLTGWSGLCRLIRAETFKLRELEFVQAARVLGVGRGVIMFRHILPNLLHIVIITLVLDFSMLVLAEAVLSYVGVGVDPTTFSWGNMINSSRLELAREPMVWWPLGGAMIFMFFLVLFANLFSDAVRDALDPRMRTERN